MTGHQPRPDWVRRVNLFGDAVGDPAHLIALDDDAMLEIAVDSTGLSDMGDEPGWEAAYRGLVAALDNDAQLNVMGRLSVRAEIIRNLQTRLRLVDLWRRQPSIRTRTVATPVFILGPPRTGTSILLELLALDPNLRPVLAHEAHFPLGPLPQAAPRSARECSEPEQELWADIAPEFITMHELRSDLPCECVHFVQPEFRSWHWPMMHELGDTAAGSLAPDFGAVYRWHEGVLQTLQHLDGDETGTFLLKSPAHLGSLPDLLERYPDARMIHTHRDPLKFVGSGANTVATLHWMRSDEVDPSQTGPMMKFAYQMMLAMVMDQREAGVVPADQMADLHFRRLMSDPVAAVGAAYEHLGLDFSTELERAIPEYLANKPQAKFGRHVYDPAALGLDEAGLRGDFADYISHYDVELES